ncbi:muts domain V-domain-containing protein, partial [Podospora fimiseda]
MAIDMDKNGKVGCAYYSAIDETLFIEEDIAMGGVEMLETLLLHVEPTSVFVSNRAPGTLVEFAERDAHRYDEDETSNGEQGSYILRHLQSVRFDYEIAKEIMVGIDLEQYEPDPIQIDSPEEERVQNIGSDSHNKLIHLGKIINFDSCLSIGCAGAVLSDLERRRNAENPNPGDEDDTSFRVKEIVMNSSADTMLISADSLMSLQITHSELHPNPHMQCPRGSEPTASKSLSVIGLIQSLASTAQGKRRLRQILLRPSTSINLIQERQIAIGILLRSKNAETANSMRKTLRKLKDTKALLLHVKKGVDRVRGELSIRIRDWEALLRFVMVTVNIGQAVDMLEGAQQVAVFTRIREEIDTSQFIVLSKVIMETFDFDASKTSGHTEIRPTASDCLSELRSEYEQLMSLLPELKQTQLNEVPKWAHKYILDCSISRQLGFLVRVTPDPETGEGMYHGKDEDEWEKILVNETGVFYATRYMNELRSQYGDLISSILDEEIALILDASQMVREYEEDIVRALELYGELDSLLAFAAAAEKYNWVPPRMTTSNVVYIVDGRHPLQELLVPAFIPNSCSLEGGNGMARPGSEEYEERCGDKKATMLILTGPNNSGKSIYMKQVALIVYLAHTGCYVPATQATIGLTDRILTRISTRETSVDDESAFMTDIKQAAFSMNFATRRSLLLLDEFGKGTTAGNGAGLLTAYLMHLLDLEAERPKVLVGTHLHEIFEPNFLESREGVELAHMEVLINKEAEDIEDQITFLHRLLPGRDPKSLGIMCAEICGFAPDFLDLADDLVEVMD